MALSSLLELPEFSGTKIVPQKLAALEAGLMAHKALLAVAPPGTGKTTFLKALAKGLLENPRCTVVWLDGRNLAQKSEDIIQNLAQELQGPKAQNEPGFTPMAFEAVVSLTRDTTQAFYIFLDNIEALSNEDARLVQRFLESTGSNVHGVMAGARNPGIALSRMRIAASVLELGASDFFLDKIEATRFLRINYPYIEDGTLEEVIGLTRGWISGLIIKGSQLNDRLALGDKSVAVAEDDPRFGDFFQEEILPLVDEATEVLVIYGCWFSWFSRTMARQVLGTNFSDKGLKSAISLGLLEPVPAKEPGLSSDTFYTWNPMFRKAIKDYGASKLKKSAVGALIVNGVGWLEENGFAKDALALAYAHENPGLAFDVLESHPHEIFATSTGEELIRWLDSMAYPAPGSNYIYCMAQAWAAFLEGKTRSARLWLRRSAMHNPKQETATKTIQDLALVGQTIELGLRVFEGNYQRAIRDGQALISSLNSELLYLKATVLHNMGEAYERLGLYEQAYEVLNRSRAIAELTGRLTVEILDTAELMWLLFIDGKLDEASGLGLRSLRSLGDGVNNWTVGVLHIAMARIYLQWGDGARAFEYLDQASRAISFTKNRDYFIECQITRARCLAFGGRNEEAMELFLASYEIAHIDYVPRGMDLFALISVAEFLQVMQQWRRASEVIDEAFEAMADTDYFYQVHGKILQARSLEHQGAWGDAEAVLQGALSLCKNHAMGILAQNCQLHLATLKELQGKKDVAEEILSETLGACLDENRIYPFWIMPRALKTLLRRLAYPDNQSKMVEARRAETSAFARKILEIFSSGDSMDAVVIESETLSRRETEVYEYLKQGKSRREIADDLGISLNTARTHIRNIYKKLGISSRSDL